jgi:glycosyltransferase involved in cell wall biosynthesis
MNWVIHLTPQWPTFYQTFVQDDIEVSRGRFDKVDVFGFRIAENNDISKFFFLIKRICLVVKGGLVLFFNIPRGICHIPKNLLSIKIIFQLFAVVGRFPKILYMPLVLHSHFLSQTANVSAILKIVNPRLYLISTAHGSEVLLGQTSHIVEIAKNQDIIVAASSAVKSKIISDFHYANKPHPLITVRYCRTPEFTNLSPSIKTSKDGLTLLSVARMHPQKGWLTCITIATLLRQAGINFNWKFIGDGPEIEQINKLIEINELGEFVEILGRKSREFCLNAMVESQFLVLPSRIFNNESDGLPVVILEAMRAGTIVVSTNVGGILEAIGNGRGILIEQNIQDTIEKIVKIGSNINARKKMVVDAQKWAVINTAMSSSDPLIKIYNRPRI